MSVGVYIVSPKSFMESSDTVTNEGTTPLNLNNLVFVLLVCFQNDDKTLGTRDARSHVTLHAHHR